MAADWFVWNVYNVCDSMDLVVSAGVINNKERHMAIIKIMTSQSFSREKNNKRKVKCMFDVGNAGKASCAPGNECVTGRGTEEIINIVNN